jgi:2-amino-4-hydroxy-6-hydroxymethyldihydropteridine diphosphokinase
VVSRAFVGIGANQGDPVGQVREALRVLSAWGPLRASSLWRSEPLFEPTSKEPQPWYVNAVAELALAGEPIDCLERLHAVECEFGRPASRPRWAPRTLDLDLLLFGDRVLRSDRLTLPHPGLATRRFVLAPLAELAPELVPPGQTRSVAALLADLDDPLRVEKL